MPEFIKFRGAHDEHAPIGAIEKGKANEAGCSTPPVAAAEGRLCIKLRPDAGVSGDAARASSGLLLIGRLFFHDYTRRSIR